MKQEPTTEHQWLQRLVGEWTYEAEAVMEPGKPPERFDGTESVRSLGGVWILLEGRNEMPGGETGAWVMTLGYDPAKSRYVGTFVASAMTNLWIYDGTLDPAGKLLTLESEGPSFTAEGKTAKYRDRIEVDGNDRRVLTSEVLGDDGAWQRFMTSTYRRTR